MQKNLTEKQAYDALKRNENLIMIINDEELMPAIRLAEKALRFMAIATLDGDEFIEYTE